MPAIGNFSWDSVDRPVLDGSQLEVGDGKTYATVDSALAAATVGDTITVFDGTNSQSFIWNGGNVIQVGVGQDYATVQEAYAASNAGDIILVHEGTYSFSGNEYYPKSDHSEPILISHDISIIGIGTATFDIGYVEKGALVTNPTTNQTLYVENITFTGAYGNSANSGGIRHQAGDLTVVNSTFSDSESGILALPETGTVHVVDSYFSGIGSDGFSHALYIQGESLIVENSHFVDALHGQHVKSTTYGQTIVVDSVLDDGTGSSSYAVDIGGGGNILLDGNTFIKGAGADNSTFVWYDANRYGGDPGEVWIQNNSFDATNYPNINSMKVVVNRTFSDVNLVNNTVDGVLEDRLIIGLGHIQNVTLDGTLLADTTVTEHTTALTSADDIYVTELTGGTNIAGEAGDDSLIGLGGVDTLWGGTGNDLLVGDDGADYLLGGANDDTIYGGDGADMLYGDSGDDLLISGAGTGDERLHGGEGNDTLSITTGYANGGADNDVIVSTGDNKATLQGGAGDDIVYGGQGGDLILGGDGIDIAVFHGIYDPNDPANSDFSIEPKASWFTQLVVKGISEAGMNEVGNGINYWNGEIFYDDKETFAGFEKLQFDNGVYDVATGTFTEGLILVDVDSILNGIPGGGNFSDPVIGTDGDDIFTVSGVNGFTTYDGGLGNDQIQASEADMFIRLTAFNAGDVETITANGFTGVSILASSSDNKLDFSATTLTGISYIDAGLGNDTIAGSPGDDTIIGGYGNDQMTGGDGNDVFEIAAGAGTDYIDGGLGVDTIRITADDVTLSLSNVTLDSNAAEQIDIGAHTGVTILASSSSNNWNLSGISMAGITYIDMQVGNDTVTGTSQSETIVGGAGDDKLYGGAGDDTFLVAVGDGSDIIEGGDGIDTILAAANDVAIGLGSFDATNSIESIDAAGHTGVTVSLTSTGSFDFSQTTFTGIDGIVAGGGSDTIHGTQAADTIDGGEGWNKLYGEDGDDVFLASSNSGLETFDGGNGVDTVRASADDTAINIDQFVAGAVEVIDAGGHTGVSIVHDHYTNTSMDFSQTMLNGIDLIASRGGQDTIRGSQGADIIDGGNGWNKLYGEGGDDVFLVASNSSLDTFDGGTGNDTIRATEDNAAINIDQFAAGAVEVISAGGHTGVSIVHDHYTNTSMDFSQTMLVGITDILGGNGQDTVRGSQGSEVINGRAGNDQLYGENGDDTLLGDTGADQLVGGLGADVLNGGADNDQLTGGDGNDVFAFGAGWGVDSVLDFTEGDVLDLTVTGLTFDDLTIVQSGEDAIISDPNGNSITVVGAGAQAFYSANLIIPGAPTEPPAMGSFLQGTNGAETINGTSVDDTIEGLNGNDTMYGNGGDDVFLYTRGEGLDRFYGGDGNDSLIVSGDELYISTFDAGDVESISGSGVTIQGTWRHNSFDFSQTILTGIAKIDGGTGNDTIHGSQGDDTILGGDNGDKLYGEAGNDVFLVVGGGGNGTDIYDGGAGLDTIRATGDDALLSLSTFAAGSVEVITSGGFANMTIASTWQHNLLDFSQTILVGVTEISGGDGNDTIYGSQGDDTLNGNSGRDVLYGEGGVNTFRYDTTIDDDIIGDFKEGDIIDLSTTSYTFASLTIVQNGANTEITDAATGKTLTMLNTDANSIDETDFVFSPPEGILATQDNEVIVLGDMFVTGEAPLISADGHSGVTIGASGSGPNVWDFSQTVLVGIGSIDAKGGDDTITGSADADTIIGGSGQDRLFGGGGDDTFLVGPSDGYDQFDGGDGTDSILATTDNVAIMIDYSFLAGAAEIVSADGHNNVTITGRGFGSDDMLDFSATTLVDITAIDGQSGEDTIHGSQSDDTILGNTGNDVLFGEGGSDIIIGGAGTDNLSGDAGNDTFLVNPGDGTDFFH
ncbi:Hemolysin-type calcium-binding repeat-containing protein, partial [Kordiimonas lacus]